MRTRAVKFLTTHDDHCKAARTPEVEAVELDPFQLLGVTRIATEGEIMSAHRRLSSVFCPDRWRDAPSEVQLEALRWSQAVDQAVQTALRMTGATRTRTELAE